MTRWWWVRHGPTHEKAFVGWRDVPADLSDTAAIARLSDYLPSGAVLLSSDLVRATATAEALGRGAPLQIADLREFNFGEWDGLHASEVIARAPDLSRQYWEQPGDVAPPGGESWNAVKARADAVVQTISARHQGRDIIAVAHSGLILTQLQTALEISPYQALGHRIDNLSVTDMTLDADRWRIGRINHIA